MYWRSKALVLPGWLSAFPQIRIRFSAVSIISQSVITIYRYIDYALWFPYAPAYHLTMSACHRPIDISTMHMLPVHWQQWASVRRGIAEPGLSNYHNNTYRSPKIIIVTLQLTCWVRHLPSLTIFASAHLPIWWSDACWNLVSIHVLLKAESWYIVELYILLQLYSHSNSL